MIRKLELEDYNKGLEELLNFLHVNNNLDKEKFIKFYNELELNNNSLILVKEIDNKIVAIGTLLFDNKLIHNFGVAAYIQDIIVHKNYRGRGYGREIIDYLKNEAINRKCYKILLNCSDDIIEFYKKNGFIRKGNEMAIYL